MAHFLLLSSVISSVAITLVDVGYCKTFDEFGDLRPWSSSKMRLLQKIFSSSDQINTFSFMA